jgi:hypothetical protein
MAERMGFELDTGIESTQLTDFACRSNRRSRVQFRYRRVARSLYVRGVLISLGD